MEPVHRKPVPILNTKRCLDGTIHFLAQVAHVEGISYAELTKRLWEELLTTRPTRDNDPTS